MSYEDTGTDEGQRPEDICAECGSHCCKLGGVVATRNEVDAILAEGYPNYFIRLSDEVYGVEWGDDGHCPYLDQSKCSIYSVRPLGCRMFPVVQTQRGNIVLVQCPLGSQLSDQEISRRKRLLIDRPEYILRESKHHRERHARELEMRASRYTHEQL